MSFVGAAADLDEFIRSLKVPIQRGILKTSPKRRVSKLVDVDLIPRRSSRLAAKSKMRASKTPLQARRVLLKKMGLDQSVASIDTVPFEELQQRFKELLSSAKREAMNELFNGGRWYLAQCSLCPVALCLSRKSFVV